MVLAAPRPASCRVISAEAKTNAHQENFRVAGVVEVGGEVRWASVREGSLVVTESSGAPPLWRLPLRGLNLQPARPIGLAFSLTTHKENHTVATFKVKNEIEYERWVKAVAAELMRQTPLDSVRFLDILGITGSLRRTRSADSLSHTPDIQLSHDRRDSRLPPCLRYRKRSDLPDVVRDLPPCSRKSRSRRREWLGSKERGQSLEGISQESIPQDLIDRCQRSDVYVPVKEKRMLFEALWRRESVTRAHSLADLTSPTQPVRDIARIFERRSTAPDTRSKHLFDVSDDVQRLRHEEETRNRKQFSLTDVKTRHHSNIR